MPKKKYKNESERDVTIFIGVLNFEREHFGKAMHKYNIETIDYHI